MYRAEEIKSYTKEEICNFKMIHKMIWKVGIFAEKENYITKSDILCKLIDFVERFWLKYRILCDRKSD